MSGRRSSHELASFGIHLIVSSVAFALVLALFAGAVTLARWALPLELASSSPQRALEASGRILELHEHFWPVTLVALVGVAIAAGWLGRRITGPLVRFTHVFRRLAAGEFPEPLQLRSTDYLAHEAAALNELVATLRTRAAERASAHDELVEILEELRETIGERGRDDAVLLVGRALDQLKALDGRWS
jgi:methyl-accepting chemotaxis protein